MAGAVQKTETPSAKKKPHIHILATGGTIAGAQADPKSYGYKSGTFSVKDLIAAVPQMKEIAQLSGEQVANIGSQDMNDAVWIKLARRLEQVLAQPDVDGVVITHGTDTMEETAFFLDLVTRSDKPVVMVGSMRPATAVSADGPGNLYQAVAVAASPDAAGRGVLVALNDEIHAARDVTKMNTTNVETFESPNGGPVGVSHTGKIRWFTQARPSSLAGAFSLGDVKALPRVDILYAHANMNPGLIKAAVDGGARGLVIAGVGDGNMTQASVDMLTDVARAGNIVVRSSRVPTGLVLRNNEINDDKLGFVASGELNPAKARVLLQLALLRTSSPRQVQQFFDAP